MSSTIDHASAAFSTPPVDDFSVAITSILMPSQSFTQGKQQQQQQASTALPLLSIILSALFLIEDVFILFFNVFAAITIIRHRQLQTRTNMAVLNLLIFDLLIGVFIPFHTAFFIYPSLATNHYACVIRIAINHAVCIATTISLIIVTADRYMAVVHPYRYSQYGAIPYLRAILVLLCFYSLGYLVSVVVFSHWPAPCNPEALLPPALFIAFFAGLTYAGCLTMTLMYARIFYVAAQQESRIFHELRLKASFQHRAAVAVAAAAAANAGQHQHQHQLTQVDTTKQENVTRQSMKRERRYAKVMATVVAAFSICWLPLITVTLLIMVGAIPANTTTFYVRTFAGVLFTCSSLINPIIYIWNTPEFRSRFVLLLPGCLRRCFRTNAVAPSFEGSNSAATVSVRVLPTTG